METAVNEVIEAARVVDKRLRNVREYGANMDFLRLREALAKLDAEARTTESTGIHTSESVTPIEE